jgi:hypothetical protein
MEDEFHRISAAALRNRGLITTAGRGRTWEARITSAGVEYLVKVDGPTPPIPRQANESVTQQLVDDLVAAGGSLRVQARPWGFQEGVDWEQRARLAQVHGKVPAGKRLRTRRVEGELEIWLEEAAPGTDVPLRPVAVPKRVTRLHPVAQRFRDDTAKHLVSRAQLPRCVRIVHALVTEAERRSFTVGTVDTPVRRQRHEGWKSEDGHLTITIREHVYRLKVFEDKVVLRGAFDAETEYRRGVNYPEYLNPRKRNRYDADATGGSTWRALGTRERDGR